MLRTFARSALILVALPVGVPVVAGTTATAAAASCDGVTVVIDFGALGRGTSTRCAQGDPSSGLAALAGAGFAYTFVPRQPGFVCTIDGKPDPCNGAPDDAYWSYWHGSGRGWAYSNEGAASYDPDPGAFEGWAFGSGDHPPAAAVASSSPPSRSPTHAPTSSPTSSPTRRPPTHSPAGTGKPTASHQQSSSATLPSGHRQATAAQTRSRTQRPVTPGATTTAARRGAAAPARSTTASRSPSASKSAARSRRPSPTARGSAAPDASSAAAVAADPPHGAGGLGGGTLAGLALGAVLVAGLGAAGFRRSRRQ